MALSPRWLVLWVSFVSGFGVRGVLRTLPEADRWAGWAAAAAQAVLLGLSLVELARAKRQLRASRERLEQHRALFRGDA